MPWWLIGFPYGFFVYRRLLTASDTRGYLRVLHAKEFDSSRLFRLLRPRYRKVAHLLRAYGFESEDLEPLCAEPNAVSEGRKAVSAMRRAHSASQLQSSIINCKL